MPRRILLLLVLLSIGLPLSARRQDTCCYRELSQAAMHQRVLIVAPHIDDEAIAAGAYAADAIANGSEVFIVYLTAGDHSRTVLTLNRLTFFASAPLTRKGKTRLSEAAEAASRLGLPEANVFLLGYPDRGLQRMINRPERALRSASTGKRRVPYGQAVSPGAPHLISNLVSDLQQVIELVEPDVVIAPIAEDRHPDHRAAAMIVREALSPGALTPQRLGYIIHTRGISKRGRNAQATDPTPGEWHAYVVTEESMRRKQDLLRAYRTQRRSPYLQFLFSRSAQKNELFLIEDL
jgi:LmbE family N-acetylglucosaminyl deacetylase